MFASFILRQPWYFFFFLSAPCSWDGGSRASAQLLLNLWWQDDYVPKLEHLNLAGNKLIGDRGISSICHYLLHDQQLRDGHTQLMWLASPGMNVDAARPVLVGGANVNQRDGAGRTALHWLAETRVSHGAEERAVGFLNLLREYHVELNAVDSYGSTALDRARQEPACPPLVAALLEAGAVGNSSAVSDAGADAPSREELQRRLVMVQEILFEEREQFPDGVFVRLSDALVGRRRM